ncbi:MAG TPA: FAD-dependent oxidoreductase [Acidimicrobiales bacterium]|nr:FAD-dependent oxidoreductase [Acidimicrobiales bacterium]
MVVVGAGIAGLGSAYRLWTEYGIRADVYEYDSVPGGRIRTLRGYFADEQIVEEHAEFVNPEHTATLALAASFGLTLDNTDKYPPGTHPLQERMRFGGRPFSQAALDRDWHEWGWKLFHDAAFTQAPWPTLYDRSTPGARRIDGMSVAEWIEANVPGGLSSDFAGVAVAAVLDEYGGPIEEQSALNLVYLLGQDDSRADSVQPRSRPQLAGANEKWHLHGGNDQLVSGILDRLPDGSVHLDERLVAVCRQEPGRLRCTFDTGTATHDVVADHVVLAIPFTTLSMVDLDGVAVTPLHRTAIAEEPLGTNSKFFAQFTSRVWNAEHWSGNVFDSGAVQGGWDATNYQPGPAGILAALPGGIDAARWGARYRLTGYRGAAPPTMVADLLDDWDRLFPGVKAAYNGHSYFVWSPGDPHILGAYSYLKVGQYTGFNGVQGRREQNLHFAGEQTSINFQGYIEGALRSGYRCAREVATGA